MNRNESGLQEPQAAEAAEMIHAMRQGVVEALQDHKQHGQSVVVWDRETQKVVEIPSEQIIIPESPQQ